MHYTFFKAKPVIISYLKKLFNTQEFPIYKTYLDLLSELSNQEVSHRTSVRIARREKNKKLRSKKASGSS